MAQLHASQVLVGRDELLARASGWLADAAAGTGRLVLVAGEAGSGKSRFLSSVARRAELAQFLVVRAAAYPGDAEVSGSVLLDLAGDLRRSDGAGPQAAGVALRDRLREPLAAEGDQHRQRRLLVQDVVDTLAGLDPRRRLLLVLEDLHWADELSLTVLHHLAGRLRQRCVLVVAAHRSDELYPGSAVREWRARLLAQRTAEEVDVPRLTVEQTGELIASLLGSSVPQHVAVTIHARSDGIPLHVEELLAALSSATDAAAEDVSFPETLADAVLVRVSSLDQGERDITAAAAVIGRSFDLDLLSDVSAAAPDRVERCLRRLRALYVVQQSAVPSGYDFRHALIRDALYSDVLPLRRRELHEAVAAAALLRGYGNAFVSAHFERAGLAEPAYRHARVAAEEASRLSARRESLALYRRALRSMPRTVDAAERASLLTALAAEAAAVDDNAAAADAFSTARALWLTAGQPLAAAALAPDLVAVRHLLGDGLDQRVATLQSAVRAVDGVEGGDGVRARLFSGLATAYMLARRLDESLDYAERSAELALANGDDRTALDSAVTQGSVLAFAGQMEQGWQLLEGAVARSSADLREAEAARAYRMIGSCASVLVEYDRAQQWLSDGIAYAATVQLSNHRSYMVAHLAHVHWARGEWGLAQQLAEHALTDGSGGITTRITALYVLGYVALGRGEPEQAKALLEESLVLGESMAELQRESPPLWGLAELALLGDDAERALSLCVKGFAASARVDDAAYLFPFLLTGTRAHLASGHLDAARQWVDEVAGALQRRDIPGLRPAVGHARGLVHLAAGDLDAARDALVEARTRWAERSRFWEGTFAVLDLARCAAAQRRHAEAVALTGEATRLADAAGAHAVTVAAAALSTSAAGPAVAAWHPLTAREWTVAGLVASGLTNPQIAGELFLSPRTVSAHVEHILAKLGVGRRAEIAAWATRVQPTAGRPAPDA